MNETRGPKDTPEADAGGAGAWRHPPLEYQERRMPRFETSPPFSRYVAVRDGIRLAIDVHLPTSLDEPCPAILCLTPFYRRFALKEGHRQGAGLP